MIAQGRFKIECIWLLKSGVGIWAAQPGPQTLSPNRAGSGETELERTEKVEPEPGSARSGSGTPDPNADSWLKLFKNQFSLNNI